MELIEQLKLVDQFYLVSGSSLIAVALLCLGLAVWMGTESQRQAKEDIKQREESFRIMVGAADQGHLGIALFAASLPDNGRGTQLLNEGFIAMLGFAAVGATLGCGIIYIGLTSIT